MTLGFESNLPTPLDSAAVIKKSMAKLGERCPKKTPLVGAPAPKLTFNGRDVLLPEVKIGGVEFETLLVPTVESPPNTDRPPVVVPANPSCVPRSRAKEREAETTRASISTCCDLRSS